jgi:hypothetical protein
LRHIGAVVPNGQSLLGESDDCLRRGFYPCDPDFLFALKQKGSKKFKAMPASLKKLAFAKLNCPNLLLPFVRSFKQWAILRLSLLFFGSPDKAAPNLE